jgi:hypothetical protein
MGMDGKIWHGHDGMDNIPSPKLKDFSILKNGKYGMTNGKYEKYEHMENEMMV